MKNYQKLTFKSKTDWLKGRSFGGSSASAIIGANPYKNKFDLFRELSEPQEELEPNESMVYGTKCEPLIREIFALDFPNYKVHSPKNFEMYRRIDKPYLTATLDGILTDKETHKKGILEIKTHDVRNSLDLENWNGQLPNNYYVQCLHYLLVMNDFEFVILCAKLRFFNQGELSKQEIRYYKLDRQELEKEINYLEKKETEFYERYVKPNKLPEVEIKF